MTSLQALSASFVLSTSDSGRVCLAALSEGGAIGLAASAVCHAGAATSSALFGHTRTAVTGGEDGDACLVDLDQCRVVSRYAGADLAVIADVVCVSEHAFHTLGSELRKWDRRQAEPVLAMRATAGLAGGSMASMRTCAAHPTQPDILLTGDADGVLAVWDAREATRALARVQAHKGALSDICFHTMPDNVLTCGADGAVLVWDFNANNDRTRISFGFYDEPNLAVDQVVDSALPLNCLDAQDGVLLCAGDIGLVSLRGLPLRA